MPVAAGGQVNREKLGCEREVVMSKERSSLHTCIKRLSTKRASLCCIDISSDVKEDGELGI
jgi:hypothetical protein